MFQPESEPGYPGSGEGKEEEEEAIPQSDTTPPTETLSGPRFPPSLCAAGI